MSTKIENASFDKTVRDAFERMKDATASAASYEISRASGEWVVRRASRTPVSFASDMVSDIARTAKD